MNTVLRHLVRGARLYDEPQFEARQCHLLILFENALIEM